jgi:3-hydroxyacyl-CoA dehydrogenase / enoyl-CoA hydratase / 3-hydroxybutyryl-CoA epimerase
MSVFRVEFPPADVPERGRAPASGPPRTTTRPERAPGGIAHLVMDDPARRVNVLDERALGDLEAALDLLEGRTDLGGLVVRSAKPGCFMAGDVEALAPLADRAQALALVRRSQAACARLAALPFATVAAIDGICLGGGAELALACSSRVAALEPHTRIGLPEILLGLIPRSGGTTRLSGLVGLSSALDLIHTGRTLDARSAERAGLVARAVPGVWLLEHAHRRLAELAASDRKRGRGSPGGQRPRGDRWRPRGLRSWFMDGTPFGRGLTLARARAMTKARTGGHYPAADAALSVLRHGASQSLEASLRVEAEWVSDLIVGPVCRNLVRTFQLAERARQEPLPGMAAAVPVERLQVVGAGGIGAGIAELASRHGIEVRLRDTDPAALARALRAVRARVAERAARTGTARHEAEGQLARVFPSLDLAGLKRTDLAIEAVVEDLDVKRRVFGELEVRMSPEAVLATHTSSLSVDELAAGLERPQRFVGMHFFDPVHRMPLVEVVRGAKTSAAALATAVTLARRLGRTPIVVNDGPGFVVNRVLMPYLREALHLVEDGYRLSDVDAAMRAFGMPRGPFELMDELGLVFTANVTAVLGRAFPGRVAPAPQLEALVKEGFLGRKSGAGLYRRWRGRRTLDPLVARLLRPARQRRPASRAVIAERMTLVMVNEAAHCLADGVVADAGTLDLALLYGAGFPPFRGGPLRHADALGLPRVEARLAALRAEKGERFRPAPLIVELAARGGTFADPAGA